MCEEIIFLKPFTRLLLLLLLLNFVVAWLACWEIVAATLVNLGKLARSWWKWLGNYITNNHFRSAFSSLEESTLFDYKLVHS